MFRQAIAASSRALRSTPSVAASRAVLRPRLQTAAPAVSIRSFQPAASRWYSESKESKESTESKEAPKAEEKAEAKEGEKNGESDAVAQLKKDLEAKDAEACDWKVRIY